MSNPEFKREEKVEIEAIEAIEEEKEEIINYESIDIARSEA